MSDLEKILTNARKAIDQNLLHEALALLEHESLKDDGEVIFLKGEIYYKLQKWGESLNQFSTYLELFPEDKKAESYALIIQNILQFYHKDLYNP